MHIVFRVWSMAKLQGGTKTTIFQTGAIFPTHRACMYIAGAYQLVICLWSARDKNLQQKW